MCDPFGQVFDTDLEGVVSRPVSARFAGVQVRVDREIGFYKSVSNEKIYGIDGPSRPISYGDQTNYLNENFVGTIVSFGDGFRTWGNRVMDGNFLAVRRTKDFIADAIEEAWIAFVDKPMNDANIKFIVETGRAFMRTLEAEGYLLKQSSDMWLDPSLNEPTEMRQGRITFSIKFEPPPPMEDIRVIAHPNIQAYTLLLDRVRGAIEGGSLAVTNL
jgi:phage tail sheath protein FI